MFYLYDQGKLKALRVEPDEAIGVARFCNAILVTNRIDEAILIARYPLSAFLLLPKNQKSLFDCWKWQWRYRTLNEFRIILYAAPKTLLYRFLCFISWSSRGTYQLIDFIKKNDENINLFRIH